MSGKAEILKAVNALITANRKPIKPGEPTVKIYYPRDKELWIHGRTWGDELTAYVDAGQDTQACFRPPLARRVLAALDKLQTAVRGTGDVNLEAIFDHVLDQEAFAVRDLWEDFDSINKKLGREHDPVAVEATYQPIDGPILDDLLEAARQLGADEDRGRTLTDRQRNILRALFERQAFDRETRMTTEAITKLAEGPAANPETFKQPMAELALLEFVETARGPKGGVWLSPKGRSFAESIS